MRKEATASFPDLSPRSGVIVVDGYGSSIRVRRGQLTIVDGIGPAKRERVFARATSRIRRVVILGHSGILSLEAVRWISDVGAALIHLDADGTVLATTATTGNDDPRLRRAQGLALSSSVGLAVSSYLIGAKLAGQVGVLASVGAEDSVLDVQASIARLEQADSLDGVLSAESRGAAAYWGVLADIEMQFSRKDQARVPDHWRTIGPRSSPLTGSPRLAVTPAGALLNYLYAVAQAEARLACLAVGLDPGLGILHADLRARDSMVLDIMETLRPQVDAHVLHLIGARVFPVTDFIETRQGACRVLPPLNHRLAETGPMWASAVASVVENVVRMLASVGRISRVSTPLTQSNRSASRLRVSRRSRSQQQVNLAPGCKTCGATLVSSRRTFCDDCLAERRTEVLADFTSSGPAALARARALGRDPSRQEAARQKLGARNRIRREEAAAWDSENVRPDPDLFRSEILPNLAQISLSAMMQATGLSRRYVWRIRRGEYVPHPRHWDAFRNVARDASNAH